MFVFFLKKNEQQLTILCDVASNGIASYCNAMQAGARTEGQTDAGGHGWTRTDTYGRCGRQWEGGEGIGGMECRVTRSWRCFRKKCRFRTDATTFFLAGRQRIRRWHFCFLIFRLYSSLPVPHCSRTSNILKISSASCCVKHRFLTLKPFEFIKFTNITCVSRHKCFRHLPLQAINGECSMRPNLRLRLNVVVPQRLGQTRLRYLPIKSELSLLDAPLCCLHPWEMRLGGHQLTVGIAALLGKLAQGLFLWIIDNRLRRKCIAFEDKGQSLIGVTFLYHWMHS